MTLGLCVCQAPYSPLNQFEWIREMTVSLHVGLYVCQAPCMLLNHCERIREMTVSLHWVYVCVSDTMHAIESL